MKLAQIGVAESKKFSILLVRVYSNFIFLSKYVDSV